MLGPDDSDRLGEAPGPILNNKCSIQAIVVAGQTTGSDSQQQRVVPSDSGSWETQVVEHH